MKKEEYEYYYENDAELEGYFEQMANEMRGTVIRGDCIYCRGKNTMYYEGDICFVCTRWRNSIHEDLYYRWLAGGTIEFEEE